MRNRTALGLIGTALTLALVGCQGNGGAEAERAQERGASRAGRVSGSKSPEQAFLDRIEDAAGRNDAKELASMLHPDVIASFGEEKCIEAFQQETAPGRVIAGKPVRSTKAAWKNAQGRTEIYTDGPAYKGAVTIMKGTRVSTEGMRISTFDFGADKSGKFFLFADCNEKVFKSEE